MVDRLENSHARFASGLSTLNYQRSTGEWRNVVDMLDLPEGTHSLALRPGALDRLTFQISAGVRSDELAVEPQASLSPDQSHERSIQVQAKLVRVAGVGFPSLTSWLPQMERSAIANCNAPATFPV